MSHFYLVILILVSFQLDGQTDNIIDRLNSATLAFRNSLINNKEIETNLTSLESRWSSIEPNDTTAAMILYNSYVAKSVYNTPFTAIKKQCKKYFPNSALPDSITKEDIKLLKDNEDIMSFFFEGFFDYKYPYDIKLDSFTMKEIEFINIQPNESIADIGSGTGNHTLILSLMYPENNFTLTEVDKYLVKYIKKKIKRNKDLLFINERNINVKKGKKKHLNLDQKVDKIILRNTFHHLKKKEDILNSIPNYLEEKGTVIVIEHLKSNTSTIDKCDEKMEHNDILKYIRSSPLEIIQEKIIDDTLLLVCKVQTN